VLKNGPSICSSEEKVNYYKRKILIFRKLHTPPPISYGKKTVNVEDPSYFIEENLDLLNELHQTIMANSVFVQKVLGSFESTFFSLFLRFYPLK